jgi:hypothetical protein
MLRDTINREMHVEVNLDLQNAYRRYLRQIAIDSVVDKLPGMARSPQCTHMRTAYITRITCSR